MAFVQPSDYSGPDYQIPNLSQESSFLAYADRQERKLLMSLLGRSLKDAFYSGYEAGTEQRWIDLGNGVAYEVNGKPYKWEGMNTMLKPFVYSRWIKHTATNLSTSGVTIPKIENAELIGPRERIIESYNEASDFIGNECNQYNTLFGYLFNSGDTFIDSLGSGYTDIKVYMYDYFVDPGKMNFLDL